MVRRNDSIRLLILSGNSVDTELIKNEINKVELTFDIQVAGKQNEFVKKAQRFDPDVVIAAHRLIRYSAIEAYNDVIRINPFVSFIVISKEFTREEMHTYMLSGIDSFVQPYDYSFLPIAIVQGINKKRNQKTVHQSQQLMIESQQRLQSVFNNDQNAIFIIGFKREIIDLNPAAVSVLQKINPELIKGKDIATFIQHEDQKKFKAAHAAACRGKKSSDQFTFSLSRKAAKQASINFTPLKNEEGLVTSVVIICKDITETFLIRQKFRLSEDRFLSLANNAPVGIYYTNAEGSCLFVNKKWSEYSGLTLRQSLGQGWTKVLHPDDKEHVLNKWTQFLNGRSDFSCEYRCINASGKLLWLRDTASRFVNEQGKVLGYTGTVTDITNDKLFEKALLDAQKRQQLSIRLAKLGEFERDLKKDTGHWSDELYKIFEINKGKEVPRVRDSIEKYIHSEDREKILKQFNSLDLKKNIHASEFRIVLPSGTIKYLKSIFTVENDLDGNPVKLGGVIQDVTHLHEQEQKLKELNSILKDAIDINKLGIWERDLLTGKRYWSPGVFHVYELDEHAGIPSPDMIRTFMHPDNGDAYDMMLKEIIADCKDFTKEIKIITAKGNIRFIQHSSAYIRNSEDKPVKVTGIVMDVTERVIAVQKLKESEEKFRYLFNHSPDGIYIEDFSGKILEVNEQACRIQGMKKEELVGKNFLDLAPENLRKDISENFKKMAQGEISGVKSFSWNRNGVKIPVLIKQNRIEYNLQPALLLHVRKIEE